MLKESKVISTSIRNIYCDKCGGDMEHAGYVSNPQVTGYSYKCVRCGHVSYSDISYPQQIMQLSEPVVVS